MSEIVTIWKTYNEAAQRLSLALGRTNNIVGEYAEYLARCLLNAPLLPISSPSADIWAPGGERYQVKGRKVSRGLTTKLSVIRSWEFDYLFVVLFDMTGQVAKAVVCAAAVAMEYRVWNDHQHGWIISTTKSFLNDPRNSEITTALGTLNA